MKKLILIPKNEQEILELKDYYDGIILSVENLSVNYPTLELSKILSLLPQINNKEIFINLNKNMHNKDIEPLKETIKKLENYNIKGILFYDLSLTNIKTTIPLVWSQCHMTTNALTCNFYKEHNTNYVLLANEITIDEIKEIKNETKLELMVQVFGYIPIFASKRHLVKNYLKTFDLKNNSNIYYIKHNDDLYPIKDSDQTVVYNEKVLNAINEMNTLESFGINYFVINSFEIENIKNVLENFKNNTLFSIPNEGTCFLHEETYYKVIK